MRAICDMARSRLTFDGIQSHVYAYQRVLSVPECPDASTLT